MSALAAKLILAACQGIAFSTVQRPVPLTLSWRLLMRGCGPARGGRSSTVMLAPVEWVGIALAVRQAVAADVAEGWLGPLQDAWSALVPGFSLF